MQISEIKKILESCQRGDILLHTYLPTQYGRQFNLFEFSGKENITYMNTSRSGRAKGYVKSEETAFLAISNAVTFHLKEIHGIKVPDIVKVVGPIAIRDGDDIYKGSDEIVEQMRKYKMGESLTEFAQRVCEKGFPE